MLRKKKHSKEVKENKKRTLRKVPFKLLAPEAQNVSLAGVFNNWDLNSHLLKKDSKGMWKIVIDLMPGRYEYRFLVDGQWKNDHKCTDLVANPFGTENCILTLK